eukprot:Selendium_serpulae@DN6140_c2_g1_i13.p1
MITSPYSLKYYGTVLPSFFCDDDSDAKLQFKVLPPGEADKFVLILGVAAFGQSSQWQVPYNTLIFTEFNVNTPQTQTYLLRGFSTLLKGLAIASSARFRVLASGALSARLVIKTDSVEHIIAPAAALAAQLENASQATDNFNTPSSPPSRVDAAAAALARASAGGGRLDETHYDDDAMAMELDLDLGLDLDA